MRVVTALLLVASLGCEGVVERPQWVVTLTTDAPLPQFGDRLLVDVIDEDGSLHCDACRRIFGDIRQDHWPLSFGVVSTAGDANVRARLFRAIQIGDDGEPGGRALIDVTMSLPPDPGVVELPLSMDCFGVMDDDPAMSCALVDDLAPIAVMPTYAEHRPATWELSQPRDCLAPPTDQMVCVPGGAFVMGDAGSPARSLGLDVRQERLVVVAPFLMDIDEVRVGAVRALVQSRGIAFEPSAGTDPYTDCTYADDGSHDELPMNCIHRDEAAQVCAALGKQLPTEAQWEWAAGNLTLETPFPWGSADDVCRFSIVGRGLVGDILHNKACRAGDTFVAAGLARAHDEVADRDVTELGIRSLGGSLSEWMRDAFADYAAPCWQWLGGPFVDPVCEAPTESVTTRGGHWAGVGIATRAATRSHRDRLTRSPQVGFRCVTR